MRGREGWRENRWEDERDRKRTEWKRTFNSLSVFACYGMVVTHCFHGVLRFAGLVRINHWGLGHMLAG